MYISAIVNCYNKEEWLTECIDSILRQTKKPDEIVIIHDGCKNPGHYAHCKTIILPENYGVAKARDVGVQNTNGDLLFVDADDVLSPDYIEKMVATNSDISYPDLFIWFEHGNYVGKNSLKIAPELTPETIISFNSIIPVTSLMKRYVYETLGGFKEMDVYEDWEFFLRAMEKGYVFKKAQTLLWYRQTSNSRNRIDIEKRSNVYKHIVSQYFISANKLCKK